MRKPKSFETGDLATTVFTHKSKSIAMKFSELEDGEEFEYGGRLYEKDSVPEAMLGIVENAICLEDHTTTTIDPDIEVSKPN